MSNNENRRLSLLDGLRPEYIRNPYQLYQQLRMEDPVLWDESAHGWVLTGFADVVITLRDPRLSAKRFMMDTSWVPEDLRETLEPPIRALTRQMLFLDPPDHTRLRGLVAKAFTPRVVDAMRPHIQQIVDELLDAVQDNGRMDVMRDFAYPLPAIVIAEMLGVPPEDRDRFTRWTENFGRLLDGGDFTLEGVFQALSGISEFIEYFRQNIRQRSIAPRDDLMQAMINAEERGDVLSEEELLGNCVLLLAAGHGTTTHLIGNGTLALLKHPDQLQQLKDDLSLIAPAIEELLRYDSPVQMTSRLAKEDLEFGGKRIGAGQEVLMCLGAANRDPAQFSDPDQLNLRRTENRYLSFGYGIHFCLGAPLARVEAEIAFSTLLRHFKELRLETEVLEWVPSLVFRGLRELPIVFA
jgi:cytochrome P450